MALGAQVHVGRVLNYHPGNHGNRRYQFHMETRFPSLQTDVSTRWISAEALADLLGEHEVDTSWLGLAEALQSVAGQYWRERLANLQSSAIICNQCRRNSSRG